MSTSTVIVGGGITGLAAAHECRRRDIDVVVLDTAPRVGGKIRTGPVDGAGLPFDVDMAADGFLVREPEMTELCLELGLGDDLVSPRPGAAHLWIDGALRRIPPGVLGAPLDPDAVAGSGIVSPAGIEALRGALDAELPPLQGDASVGEVLRPRVGDEVFERMVDPLLGGINAGNADHLSIRAGAATLAGIAEQGGRFGDALRAHVAAATPGPVFHGVRGGSGRIIDALAAELGPRIHTDTSATGLERDGDGWVVHTPEGPFRGDRVILAAPGRVDAELLAPHAPAAAAHLRDLRYADAILVTFVAPAAKVATMPDGPGFLVPRGEGLLMTACSVSSSKWAHYDDGEHVILRVSAGRTDDPRWVSMPEDEVVATLRAELTTTMGVEGDVVARATPWRASLPQYAPGHLGRCDEIDAELAERAPGVVVAGAAMRGLGLPACVRQGRAAAR